MADNKSSVPSASEKQSYKFLLDAALARKREQLMAHAEEEQQALHAEDEAVEESSEEFYDESSEVEKYAEEETEEKAGQSEMNVAPPEATQEKTEQSEPARPIVVPAEKNYFRIGEVAELLRVEPHVLRYWESEFSQIRPTKSGGQRVYNRKAVECLVEIRDLLYDQGFSISGARKKLKEFRAPKPQPAASPEVGMPREELVALEKGLRELIRYAESNTAF